MNAVIDHKRSDTTKTICFPLGHLVATPGALEFLDRLAMNGADLLQRHQRGDWGDVAEDDAEENERAVTNGRRIMSSYNIDDECIWIITEADRSSTTILLPDEY